VLFSAASVLFFGFLGGFLFEKMKLPPLIGMLLAGIVIGPSGFDLLSDALLEVAHDLRVVALIIILLRAGLGLDRSRLGETGKRSLPLAIIPNLLEGLSLAVLAMWFFEFTFVQGAILGFIVAAVSPAVVVPAMLNLMDRKIGMKRKLPVVVLTAASLDDVFAIALFSSFLGLYLGTQSSFGLQLFNVPLAIFLGVLLGLLVGLVLLVFFRRFRIRDSRKVVLLLAVSMFLVTLEERLEDVVMVSAFLGVMAIGVVIAEGKSPLATRLSIKLSKVWVFAQILLFVLVGAAVDVSIALEAGLLGIGFVFFGLFMRSIGVLIATSRSRHPWRERLFIVASYWPKATVQAAVGAVPLAMGVAGGELILAISVLSILLSAPLGAFAIKRLTPFCLDHPSEA